MPTIDKSTRWCFTAFEGAWQYFVADKPPEWAAEGGWQTEVCPQTQRHHYQGYLRTKQQVRLSFLMKQMPGVHFEIARDWYKAKNYTLKKNTAVPNTQVKWDIADNSALTMTDTLMMIADNVGSYLADEVKKHEQMKASAKLDDLIKEEFWYAVNRILMTEPQLAQRFATPDVERMWKKTRFTWVLLRDRQTDSSE